MIIKTLSKIQKKNGEVVPFEVKKIEGAVQKAINEMDDPNDPIYVGAPERVAEKVCEELSLIEDLNYPNVNMVHKLVENTMMDLRLHDAARAYFKYRDLHKLNIFKKRINIKPYEYYQLLEYIDAIRHSYWIHTEFNYNPDIQDIKVNLKKEDVTLVLRAMLAISQIESAVKEFWGKIGDKLPKPEIKKVGATFAESEVRHEDAYSHLVEILGLNSEFNKLNKVPAMQKRVEYLEKVNQNNKAIENKDFFESIILFSMFIENVSLFSQFLIIMSFNKHGNMLKGMSNAVEATSKEETIHAMFGFELVNIIKKENPDWWTEELVTHIKAMTQQAYEAEMDIIDWMYEDGDSEFAPKEQTAEYIKKRFNTSLLEIGVEPIFTIDEDIVGKTVWFDEEIDINKDTDFFNKRSTAYTKKQKSVSKDDLF
jgi:ribonucleoside-diphosphate reductase beta chain